LRLYHRTNFILMRSMSFVLLLIAICACSALQNTQDLITVTISVDNKDIQVNLASSSTVQQAINIAQVDLSTLDTVQPLLSTQLVDESRIEVTRVREEYYVEQVIIPFTHQELENEALPQGEKRLSQPGVNGLEEVTYRRLFENEVEVSNIIVKSVVIKEPIPEVIMIGSQPISAATSIPGKIAFLSAGNAWIIKNTTANRQLVISTGDLDGRVFSLSKNGEYLLFTRFSSAENSINKLWLASLEDSPIKIIDLGVKNIVHFAEFNPDSTIVAYSSVEWRETSPGWQANNDLFELSLQDDRLIDPPASIIKPNSGGVYGWWGIGFSWSPDQLRFLYTRPDSIGIIDVRDRILIPLLNIDPYQTGSNWAWVPGAAWSPDGKVIYAVAHATPDINGLVSKEFNLVAIPLSAGEPVNLVKNVGMFAYPVPSPISHTSDYINPTTGENLTQDTFTVAYLQALFPNQSETSQYSLFVIDRDGSNQRKLFPVEGATGLEPQHVVWSPNEMGDQENYAIAFIYSGNIWIIDSGTGVAQQITADGLTERIDWR
jgi:hypothetical protein